MTPAREQLEHKIVGKEVWVQGVGCQALGAPCSCSCGQREALTVTALAALWKQRPTLL